MNTFFFSFISCFTKWLRGSISRIVKTTVQNTVGATWMDLEILMLNEASQTEKDENHMISLICGILKKAANELIHKTETELQM